MREDKQFKAVLRFEKIKNKAELNNKVKHIKRKSIPDNADPSKVKDNITLSGSDNPYQDYCKFLKKFDLKPRKNGVIGQYWVISASPEFFRENPSEAGIYEQEKLDIFVKQAQEFISENFDKELILTSELHLDETTPHIEFIYLPVEYNERFSKFRFNNNGLFNAKKLEELQDKIYQKFKPFGFVQQEKKNKKTPTRNDINDYYRKVEANKIREKEQQSSIKALLDENERLEAENYRLTMEIERLKGLYRRLKKYVKKLKYIWEMKMRKLTTKEQELNEKMKIGNEAIDYQNSIIELSDLKEEIEENEAKRTAIKKKNKPVNSNKLRAGRDI